MSVPILRSQANRPNPPGQGGNMAGPSGVRESLKAEIDKIRHNAATSIDPCVVSQAIAISDSRVQELVISKSEEGNIFKGMHCRGSGVIFNFDPPEGKISLISPSFMAVVNLHEGRVTQILDPFISDPTSAAVQPLTGSLPFSLSIPSNAPNVLIPETALASASAREGTFMGSLGLQSTLTASYNTPYQTAHQTPNPTLVSTTTYCPHADDSRSEYQADGQHLDFTGDSTHDP